MNDFAKANANGTENPDFDQRTNTHKHHTQMSASKPKALSWAQLTKLVEGEAEIDTARGPANPGATIRLFGTDTPTSVRVTLYRDRHFWCPYCQKVALWLEENKVRARKALFCRL